MQDAAKLQDKKAQQMVQENKIDLIKQLEECKASLGTQLEGVKKYGQDVVLGALPCPRYVEESLLVSLSEYSILRNKVNYSR